MKILIVDNLTYNSEYLKSLLKDHQVDVQIYKQLQLASLNEYDLYILTGTHHNYMGTVIEEWDNLLSERELIMDSNKPIIGICYGYELIATVFGSEIDFYEQRVRGDYKIKFIKDIGLDINKEYTVYGNHLLYISKVGQDLETIASSEHGPEIIKHKTKPIYGLQFHPEKEAETTDGDEILLKILESFTA